MQQNFAIVDRFVDAIALEELLKNYTARQWQPVFGYEIEFYLPANNQEQLSKKLQMPISKERQAGQYEIANGPFTSISELLESIAQVKTALLNNQAILSPKPYPNSYGNGMHLHFNILTADGNNLFDDEKILHYCANGLCYYLNQTVYAILNSPQDYERLAPDFMAPTHVCYGNDNRTAAIRIPIARPKRLEYRLCSNWSNCYVAIFVILKSVLLGIKGQYCSYEPIFGRAFDTQYNLTPIATSLASAKKLFNPDFFK